MTGVGTENTEREAHLAQFAEEEGGWGGLLEELTSQLRPTMNRKGKRISQVVGTWVEAWR